ncbi:hypothetical protein [Streptomyces sp. NPDC005859]
MYSEGLNKPTRRLDLLPLHIAHAEEMAAVLPESDPPLTGIP